MSLYDSLSNTAARLITEYGRAVSILYKESGQYSPGTDKMVGASIETVETFAAITFYDERQIDETLIRAGDQQALIFAKDITKPRLNDILNDNGIEYNIVRVSEVGPGDTPLIYKLQIRR